MSNVYFSACCGKRVDRHSVEEKRGYVVVGRVAAEGDYYCSRCKRDVTSTGNVKKSARNADISINGSWDYTFQ